VTVNGAAGLTPSVRLFGVVWFWYSRIGFTTPPVTLPVAVTARVRMLPAPGTTPVSGEPVTALRPIVLLPAAGAGQSAASNSFSCTVSLKVIATWSTVPSTGLASR